MMITEYSVGPHTVVYSSADIFSWGSSRSGKTVVVMYASEGETNEFTIRPSYGGRPGEGPSPWLSNKDTKMSPMDGDAWVFQWSTSVEPQIVSFGDEFKIYMLWREDAYNYWTLELEAPPPISAYSHPDKEYVMVKAGYLMRTANIAGNELQLTGDFNTTTEVELIFDPTDMVQYMTVNGQQLKTTTSGGVLKGIVKYDPPALDLPDFSQATWKTIDSLPEIQPNFDDSRWTPCDETTSSNDQMALETPFSLFANEYGYDTGSTAATLLLVEMNLP